MIQPFCVVTNNLVPLPSEVERARCPPVRWYFGPAGYRSAAGRRPNCVPAWAVRPSMS
jgi:hypothetical protein